MRRRGTITALTLAMLLAPAAVARADVIDDNPAAASRGPGDMWVFIRAGNGDILERHLAGGAWTTWNDLGGGATSGPAAAAYGSDVDVFIRGAGDAVYQRVYTNGAWTPSWTSLGGQATSAPSANWRRGPLDYFDLAVRGIDNTILFESYVPGHGWSGFTSLGNNATSAPALNSQADGIVNVFARGPQAQLIQQAFNSSQWVGWGDLQGTLTGAPAVVSRTTDVVDVFVRGLNDITYQRHWDSTSSWGGWTLLDESPIDSAPAAAADSPDHVVLFARRGDDLVTKDWQASSGWSPWTDFGPAALPAPAPPAAPAPAPPATTDELRLLAGVACTPAGARVRVSVGVKRKKGASKPRVTKIVFYTKGKGRAVQVDSRAPFLVHLKVNAPAGSTGRVYARVYFRRSKRGKLHHKTVSRRFSVCR